MHGHDRAEHATADYSHTHFRGVTRIKKARRAILSLLIIHKSIIANYTYSVILKQLIMKSVQSS